MPYAVPSRTANAPFASCSRPVSVIKRGLGRSLTHLLGFLEELNEKRVDLYLQQHRLDTSTAAGRALLQMCGMFAEFERSMIREQVTAGLARGKEARHPER